MHLRKLLQTESFGRRLRPLEGGLWSVKCAVRYVSLFAVSRCPIDKHHRFNSIMRLCLNQNDETHHETSNSSQTNFQKRRGFSLIWMQYLAQVIGQR